MNGRLDPAFGHWLAGFVDGEGCFHISLPSRGSAARALFQLKLRADDLPILQEIHRRTGLGSVQNKHALKSAPANWSEQASWWVQSRADCLALVEIFDEFPLRAKKARDFAIWREAVHEWNAVDRYRAMRDRRTARFVSGPVRDWSRMHELRDELMAVRRFVSEQRRIPSFDMACVPAQLSLIGEGAPS